MVLNTPADYSSYSSCFAVVLRGVLGGFFHVCQSDYSIHSKLRISPLFRSHTWNYNIQPNKILTKVKEK